MEHSQAVAVAGPFPGASSRRPSARGLEGTKENQRTIRMPTRKTCIIYNEGALSPAQRFPSHPTYTIQDGYSTEGAKL